MQDPTVVELHRLVWNPTGRRSALLLHGLASDAATMWRLAAALADAGARVVAPDLRGHGMSPPTADYSLAGYVADVAALGDGWDLVVGHSLGGSILAHLLCEDGFAHAAVLLDPLLALNEEESADAVAAMVQEVAGRATVGAVLDANPRWDREDVLRKLAAAARVTDRVVRMTLTSGLPWDLRDLPSKWQAHVQVLVAGDGSMLGHGALGALAGHEVTIVGGAGHSVHRDEPDVVLGAVREAFDRGQRR